MTTAVDRPASSDDDRNGDTATETATGNDANTDTGTATDIGTDAGGRAVAGAARGTAANLIGSVVGAVVGFATIGVITNRYGTEGSGLFFAATALFTLAANGARLGSESGLTYFVARLRAEGRDASVPLVVRVAVGAGGALALFLALAGLAAAPALADLLTDDPDRLDDTVAMVRILAVAVPAFTVGQALFGASRGFATMRPAVVVSQIVRPVGQLVSVLVAVALTDALWGLAAAWAVSSVVATAAIGVWVVRRLARVTARHGPPPDDDTATDYLRFAGPRALADVVSAALERLDVVLVAVLVGEAGAGLYGAAGRLILAGQLMMIATSQSMAPLLTASFATGRHDEARRVLRTITGWNVTLLWPVFLCLGLGAPTVLRVFGPEFTDAWPLVVVLSVAMLVIVALGGGDTLLTMTGDSRASLLNHLAALGVMVGVGMVLLPRVGIVGAAWAWALSRITLRGLAVERVRRSQGIHAIGTPVVVAAGVALVAYLPVGVGALIAVGPGATALAVAVGVGGLIHLALLTRVHRILELDLLVPLLIRRRGGGVA